MASPQPLPLPTPAPSPARAVSKAGGAWREFRDFAFTGSVLDLAIGVVLGSAFNAVVQSVVANLLTPLIGLIGGNSDLVNTTIEIGGAELGIGDLVNTAIYFLITAIVLFVVVKAAAKVRRVPPLPPAPPTRPCRFCLEEVPVMAIRCRYCTSVLVETNGARSPLEPAR